MAEENTGWYYCLDHKTVEPWDGCKSTSRLGPYATAEEAGQALEKVAQRNERWDAEDSDWDGED